MNGGGVAVDIFAGLLLIALAVGGYRAGILRSAFGIAGLVLGGFAAYLAIPWVVQVLPSADWRIPGVVIAGLVLLGAGYALGAALGSLVRTGAKRMKLRVIDGLAGAAATVVVGALALGVVASSLTGLGAPIITQPLANSSVLRGIDSLTPEPLRQAALAVRGLAVDEGAPWVLDALGLPVTTGEAPAAGSLDGASDALSRASQSVARVSGVAIQCGTGITGSGFVISDNRIVTNAHVVAGVVSPVVELPGRMPLTGRVVYFDPIDDLAVLAVSGLDATALPLGETLAVGDIAAVQGYPLGGPLRTDPASIDSVGVIPIDAIDGSGANDRESYTLAGRVQSGNSGGPLVSQSGEVIGVVFARARDSEDIGFAMTMAELLPVAAQAPDLSDTVSTGSCR